MGRYTLQQPIDGKWMEGRYNGARIIGHRIKTGLLHIRQWPLDGGCSDHHLDHLDVLMNYLENYFDGSNIIQVQWSIIISTWYRLPSLEKELVRYPDISDIKTKGAIYKVR